MIIWCFKGTMFRNGTAHVGKHQRIHVVWYFTGNQKWVIFIDAEIDQTDVNSYRMHKIHFLGRFMLFFYSIFPDMSCFFWLPLILFAGLSNWLADRGTITSIKFDWTIKTWFKKNKSMTDKQFRVLI